MHEIIERVCIPEETGPLWREIGKFSSVGAWHPMLKKVEADGEHEGCQRVAETRDGIRQTERLLQVAPHRYLYRIENTAMPVRDYVAELRVEDNGDHTSTVIWSAAFVTQDDDEDTVAVVRKFLKAGLDNLSAMHSGPQF
jgi:Polyketide cyclase / dehydrase and lipid transport